jgi:hypothetical protein
VGWITGLELVLIGQEAEELVETRRRIKGYDELEMERKELRQAEEER